MKERTRKALEESHYYLALGTQAYFEEAECLEQDKYARELKKPFRILLEEGVTLPEGYLEGIEDYKIAPFVKGNEKSYKGAILKLFGDIDGINNNT